MRLLNVLFVFLFLSACSVYTVTNKTDQNLQLKIAGGENRDLRAGACVQLTEYFMGLGGDFPFGIYGYEREFNPNNYEIIKISASPVSAAVNSDTGVAATTNSNGVDTESAADSNTETGTTVNLERGYKIVNSDKNLECEPEESEGEDVSLEPLCEDGKNVVCDGSKAQCKKGATAPVCVDNNDKELTDVKPICADSSKKPLCKETATTAVEGSKIDNSAKAICVSGTSRCESGTLGCAEIKGRLTPVCIGSDGKSSGEVLCSEMKIPKVICIKKEEKVEVQANVAVSCNQGTAQCDARSVCGSLPEAAEIKPYCVNIENIRWPTAVTCPDGSTPTCSQQ